MPTATATAAFHNTGVSTPKGPQTPAGATGVAAALTPMVSTPSASVLAGGTGDSAAQAAATARTANGETTKSAPDLFDPSHTPTLLPRICRLCELLAQAAAPSKEPRILAASAGGASGPSVSASASAFAPGGTISEPSLITSSSSDEFQASNASSMTKISTYDASFPPNLKEELVKEAHGLREALENAKKAVRGLEGGEFDLQEQKELMALLNGWEGAWRSVSEKFLATSEFCRV